MRELEPIPGLKVYGPRERGAGLVTFSIEGVHSHDLSHFANERGVALRAVMCERLGPQVWADTPGAAMAILEELEETARLWLRGGRTATPLPRAEIDALCAQFNVVW